MKITDLIAGKGTAFSFEVLPPKKGEGIGELEYVVETLLKYHPKYINITTHQSEPVYKKLGNGLVEVEMARRRPGTVAVAAALQYKYQIPVVPHILCSGFTKQETEYVLLDLQFLGIQNLLLLRGDKKREDAQFRQEPDGHQHTTELQLQVNDFNEGRFVDGSEITAPGEPFSYGVACYPEKHDEAPNLATDIAHLKEKTDRGAEYAVTQMFFDNEKYFDFVKKVREAGVNVPIIPGIKPIISQKQLTSIPTSFHCDIPEAFTREMLKATTKEDQFKVGTEWCVAQCRELIRRGAPSIHFYTSGRARSVDAVAKEIF
jgi:methylenetetrahydrofolate reductase (NADPH)